MTSEFSKYLNKLLRVFLNVEQEKLSLLKMLKKGFLSKQNKTRPAHFVKVTFFFLHKLFIL